MVLVNNKKGKNELNLLFVKCESIGFQQVVISVWISHPVCRCPIQSKLDILFGRLICRATFCIEWMMLMIQLCAKWCFDDTPSNVCCVCRWRIMRAMPRVATYLESAYRSGRRSLTFTSSILIHSTTALFSECHPAMSLPTLSYLQSLSTSIRVINPGTPSIKKYYILALIPHVLHFGNYKETRQNRNKVIYLGRYHISNKINKFHLPDGCKNRPDFFTNKKWNLPMALENEFLDWWNLQDGFQSSNAGDLISARSRKSFKRYL